MIKQKIVYHNKTNYEKLYNERTARVNKWFNAKRKGFLRTKHREVKNYA